MKKLLFLGCVSATTILLLAAPSVQDQYPPLPNGKLPGRFELFAAAIADSQPPHYQHPVVLRIDTATGQTWECDQLPLTNVGGASVATVWSAVSENYSALFDSIKRAVPSAKP